MIHHGEELIITFVYFIVGLIISTLLLLFDSKIDSEKDYFFLFLMNFLYPLMLPFYIIKKFFKRY